MAELVLKNCKIYVDGYDFSGDHNNVTVSLEKELQDKTTFGSSGRKYKGGMRNATVNGGGFFNATPQDAQMTSNIGVADKEVFVAATGTTGTPCYFFKSVEGEYNPLSGANIGEVAPFDFNVKGSGWTMARGTILTNKTSQASSGVTSVVNIGGASSSQLLFATAHITSVSSSGLKPNITAKVQISSSSGFGSASTAITFTASTAKTGQILRSTANSTETWARGAWTVASSSVNYNFVIAAGIV